jgi:hypothetical protein
MSGWWIKARDDKVGRTAHIDRRGNLPTRKIKHHDLASMEGNKAELSVEERNTEGHLE